MTTHDIATDPDDILWRPSPEAARATEMDRFRRFCEARTGRALPDYRALHAWSIAETEAFWDAMWDFSDILGDKGLRIAVPAARKRDWRFFPDARFNFAENLLAHRGPDDAIVFEAEDKARRRLSRDALRDLVSRLQQGLEAIGVEPGDRVVAMMPNIPETVAFMLAAVALGATFASASPDFGIGGIIDRFGQIEPVAMITCDGYFYAGKTHAVLDKVAEIVERLPSLRATIVVPYIGAGAPPAGTVSLETFLAPYKRGEPRFVRLPFDHPLYILFSSGTTGVPKCIVHRAGGVLLQHAKEHRLHCDIKAGDRVYWFTTLSWMMWNWLVSNLAYGAAIMLYDGSPFHPTQDVILDYAARERFTLLGTSAKYIDALRKQGARPIDTHAFPAMRTLLSTGSPLAPANFSYVYEAWTHDAHLASVSGGTDICTSFIGADPTGPVRIGELEVPSLGMAVEIWDDDGKPTAPGVKGELVCTNPFPSMPLGFLGDADGSRYHDAYFARFDDVWTHGDYVEVTPSGGYIIHGRSDATLNPGGVRIGTAEIYAQVEKIEAVAEALAIGQSWEHDTRIVLFVRLVSGAVLDEALVKRIKQTIRTGATPRHVPAVVIAVPDIPRTKSGKITELAVRDLVNGREVKNADALINPEALDHFRDIPELKA